MADVGDLEGTEDRSVRLAFKQEAKALFDQALCICFAACEALDITRTGGNAVARRPSGGYFDFVDANPRKGTGYAMRTPRRSFGETDCVQGGLFRWPVPKPRIRKAELLCF